MLIKNLKLNRRRIQELGTSKRLLKLLFSGLNQLEGYLEVLSQRQEDYLVRATNQQALLCLVISQRMMEKPSLSLEVLSPLEVCLEVLRLLEGYLDKKHQASKVCLETE
jgi:hypothetical protein